MLLFKKEFLDAIRSGEKTQTIRLWKYARMRAGQRSYIPGAGYIQIERVDPVELDELTDADARPDGFASAAELRREIAQLYAGRGDDEQPYRVVFRLLEPAEQQACRAERERRRRQRTS